MEVYHAHCDDTELELIKVSDAQAHTAESAASAMAGGESCSPKCAPRVECEPYRMPCTPRR